MAADATAKTPADREKLLAAARQLRMDAQDEQDMDNLLFAERLRQRAYFYEKEALDDED